MSHPFDFLYETEGLSRRFGDNWCGPAKLDHGVATLVAHYEPSEGGDACEVWCTATPAVFFTVRVKLETGVRDIKTGSGTGMAQWAHDTATLIIAGMLGFEPSTPPQPGHLTVHEDGDACCYTLHSADGRWFVALRHNGESMLDKQRVNMRRLAACWNACDGIETEELEHIADTGGMLGPRQDVARIAEQRDQLLVDLIEAAATLRRYEVLHRAKGTPDSDAKAEVNAALAARFEATIDATKDAA